MRYPNLTSVNALLNWAQRLVLQLERDFSELSSGKGTVTLTASDTSTTLTDAKIGPTRKIMLFPKTANAAAALATTYIADGDIDVGTATISHASDTDEDQTFDYVIF